MEMYGALVNINNVSTDKLTVTVVLMMYCYTPSVIITTAPR